MVGTGRYRSVFHTELPADEAFTAANRELRGWLGGKNLDREAFDRGSARVGKDGQVVLALSRNTADGGQTRRWQLREPKDDGSWVTTLTVHAPGRAHGSVRSWFWLDVEFLGSPHAESDSDDASPFRAAAVPRLARGLLDAVDAQDSLAEVREKPVLVRPPSVEPLIHVLCDPDRRMPVIVASAHPQRDFESWRGTIERATRFAAGLAALYLLDPHAMEEFNREIGASHAVWGGAVRTYLPDVDPATAEDARRHRVLTPARVEDDPRRVQGLLAGLPRRLSAEALLPRPLAGLSRALLSEDVPAARPGAASPDDLREIAALREENERLRGGYTAALELVDEAGRVEEALARRNSELAALSTQFSAVNQHAESLRDEVRALRRRLVQAGRKADTYTPPEERTFLPASFAELLDRVEELERVEFTGDEDQPLHMDEMPSAASWAQTAWQAMLAMNDYAEASATGRFSGGFRAWCTEPPSGAHAISAGKVAADESDTVKASAKMSRARLLPVPVEVDPSGRLHMWAHVRLGGGAGMSAPRLHYADAVKQMGKIYIGYLGPHLPVKSTN
ncbi:hypothetical protein BJF79_13965 [Actinomadura sp. CNU-125]|uniref:hypothetical protein n=1 Tax=Actinomadura sp. CNU-125 TaxID=1904961 RepID=UPI00095D18FE|nr:hypothetical protein [Actinomadura sp. CNU-125]OLT24059.1 hypothetical protein BJF79_13965 [Actinomadura sp. CNU-125]